MNKFRFLAGVTLLSASALAPLAAQARAYIDIDVAPPAPQVEEVPAPRDGYTWAPGYYAYDGHQHVWHKGTYVRNRPGYHYRPDHWEQRGDKYHRVTGGWEKG